MIAFKKKPVTYQYGVVQMFMENGKVVFHFDGLPEPVVKFIPANYRVFGWPDDPNHKRTVPPAHRFVLGVIKKLGWEATSPDVEGKPTNLAPVFVFCDWGWEMRIRRKA